MTTRDPIDLDALDCHECPVGRASGVGRGGFCPWISREVAAGEVIARYGEHADYVWFVKDGAVGLREPGGERITSIRTPGNFVGLECLTGGRRAADAVALAPAQLCGATREGFASWLEGNLDGIRLVLDAAETDPAVDV